MGLVSTFVCYVWIDWSALGERLEMPCARAMSALGTMPAWPAGRGSTHPHHEWDSGCWRMVVGCHKVVHSSWWRRLEKADEDTQGAVVGDVWRGGVL
jgi:hypothetical protein